MKSFDKLLIGIVLGVLMLVGVVFAVALLRPAPADESEQTPEPGVRSEEPGIPTTQVIVALQPIPQGSEFVAGSIGRRDWPANNVPPDIIADEAETIGAVAATEIVQGQVIVRSMLTAERDAASWHNQGLQYAEQNDYQEAIKAFSESINAFKPDLAETYLQRGLIYHRLGDYEQAVADYSSAIELKPDFPLAYNNRGWSYFQLGNSQLAIVNYTKAIELDPSNPEFTTPYNNRGWTYYLEGDYDRALADFNQAIDLNPTMYAYIRRAVTYDASGDPEQAARDFELAIDHYSGDVASAHNGLAWTLAYDLDTHYDLALEHALLSVELDPDDYNHDTLALVYFKLEQYEKALEHYNTALSLDANQAESYRGRGNVYLALGNKDAALADYEIYLSLVPEGLEREDVEKIVKTLREH
jgi:tetratricopeptide (TPR) repeat protein